MSTWIFLRGLTRESRHWGRFPETFRQAIPDAVVHAPDLPGNGLLHAHSSPMRVEEMAECCRAQLQEQGVAPPYHVLAMSLGAMAAVAWAKRHPEEICACVLINTSLRPFNPFFHRLKPGSYFPLLHRLLFGGTAYAWENTILELTSRRVECPGAVLQDWVGYRSQCPVSTANALRQLLAAARYKAPDAGPPLPMLVLASEQDNLVDPRCSRSIARRWNAAFAAHPTAGHDLPLDDGPWVADQVRQWLQASGLPPSATEKSLVTCRGNAA